MALHQRVLRPSVFLLVRGRSWGHPRHSPRRRRRARRPTHANCSSAWVCTQSLKSISDRLLITEKNFAFLDDFYLVCRPNRVAAVYETVRQELQRHTNIDVHCGKTKIWNRSGEKPSGVDQLTAAARVQDPCAIRVEGRCGAPSFRARYESPWRAVRSGRVRNQLSGEEDGTPRHSVSQDSVGPRRPSQLVVAVLLRRHEGQLLFAQRDPRSGTFVRHLPRLEGAPLSV